MLCMPDFYSDKSCLNDTDNALIRNLLQRLSFCAFIRCGGGRALLSFFIRNMSIGNMRLKLG